MVKKYFGSNLNPSRIVNSQIPQSIGGPNYSHSEISLEVYHEVTNLSELGYAKVGPTIKVYSVGGELHG